MSHSVMPIKEGSMDNSDSYPLQNYFSSKWYDPYNQWCWEIKPYNNNLVYFCHRTLTF